MTELDEAPDESPDEAPRILTKHGDPCMDDPTRFYCAVCGKRKRKKHFKDAHTAQEMLEAYEDTYEGCQKALEDAQEPIVLYTGVSEVQGDWAWVRELTDATMH